MYAKKSLGQNFLQHPHIADMLIESIDIKAGEHILEIGPGTGVLTRQLLKKGAVVTAVEKDDRAIPLLSETFKEEIGSGALRIIHGDALTFTSDTLSLSVPYKIAANIPYYITGALLEHALTMTPPPTDIAVLVQKEVAERIARDKKESILSLSVKVFGIPSYVARVARGNFHPVPNVDSAILSIRNISHSNFTNAPQNAFFSIVKTGFSEKRKMVAKNLTRLVPQEQVLRALAHANIDMKTRAEDIPLKQWVLLAEYLSPFLR